MQDQQGASPAQRPVLLQLSFVIPLPTAGGDDDGERVHALLDAAEGAVVGVLGPLPEPWGWSASQVVYLDVDSVNAGQCARCNRWTTDVESAAPVAGLQRGARLDEDLLCDECLPPDHPAAF